MNHRSLLIALSFIFCFSGFSSWGAGLGSPFEPESAAVLPKQIRSPRLKSIMTSTKEGFTEQGSVELLGKKLSKSVLWSNLIDAQETGTQKKLLQGSLASQGFPESGEVGQTTGAINVDVNVNAPIFSYGVSEIWTLALAVPIYKVSVRASVGFVKSNQAQAFINDIASSNPVKAQEVAENLRSPLETKLNSLGYEPIQNEDFTALGDIKLVSKYQFFNQENDTVALRTDLTLPTGKSSQVDKLIDVSTGDGQYDFGASVLWDHAITPAWITNVFGGVNFQLPDRVTRRIPTSDGDPLSSDIENVDRDSGDQWSVGTSIQYGSASDGFYGVVGVNYQYMEATRFFGTRYSGERYTFLEHLNGSQELTSSLFQIGYSTIGDFQRKKIAVPLQAHLSMGQPISGKNTTLANVYMAELVLFF